MVNGEQGEVVHGSQSCSKVWCPTEIHMGRFITRFVWGGSLPLESRACIIDEYAVHFILHNIYGMEDGGVNQEGQR